LEPAAAPAAQDSRPGAVDASQTWHRRAFSLSDPTSKRAG
jgi:hypothetical protein